MDDVYADFLSSVDSRRQAAADTRLAACAPQIRKPARAREALRFTSVKLFLAMPTELSIPNAEDLKSRARELRRFL
jgi:hypothetical protein